MESSGPIEKVWKCIECKQEGTFTIQKPPKTVDEFRKIAEDLKTVHQAVSPECKANSMSEEKASVGGSIRSYVQLSDKKPDARDILRTMPMHEQLSILRTAVNKFMPGLPDDPQKRYLTDILLICEQFDIRLRHIEQFIEDVKTMSSRGRPRSNGGIIPG